MSLGNFMHRGSLDIIIGPMFCGKTSLGNQKATVFADIGFNVARVSHVLDKRDDCDEIISKGNVTTHNSSFTNISDKIKQYSLKNLEEIRNNKHQVILVDEGQFFDDLYDVVIDWVENDGKHLIVSGLCGDFERKKFGKILDLIPHCDNVKKLQARCYYCLQDLAKSDFKGNVMSISAPFTFRKNNDKNQVHIGGKDDYIPVCRYHHNFYSKGDF